MPRHVKMLLFSFAAFQVCFPTDALRAIFFLASGELFSSLAAVPWKRGEAISHAAAFSLFRCLSAAFFMSAPAYA